MGYSVFSGARSRIVWQIGLMVCGLGMLQQPTLVHSETIHFTNSPHSILTSKNFTTYEIEVPGAKPITIIEATDPYRDVSNGELDSREDDLQHQQQRIPSPTTSFRTSTGIRVTKPIGESSLLESAPSGRKTLYSPELLNKFLKEYSEKLRNADSLTRKRLNEITMITNGGGKPDQQEHEESVNRNGTPEPGVSSTSEEEEEDEAKTEDELIFDETAERNVMALGSSNKRWYQEPPQYPGHHHQQQQPQQQQHQNHHPWNVKDGWVTLEAVPWSESKVSKWHAANGDGTKKHRPSDKYWNAGVGDGAGSESEESGGSRYKPIAAIYPTGSSSIGASSYYQGELPGGDSAEDYGGYGGTIKNRPKANGLKQTPPDSLYNRRRPTVTLYSERPDGPQVDRWYEGGPQATVATSPSSDPYDTMKAYHHHHQQHHPGASSAHRDIITDGRPPNFPKFNAEQPHAGDAYGSGSVTSSDHRVRPVSYPDRGNGEWVLISTTKGYQYPKRRHGQRAITFAPASSTSHQTVKLTVLPMKNALDMTTSHNGLIEVSSSTQTVEDAVKEQQHNKRKGPQTTSSEAGIGNALPTRRKQKKKHPSSLADGSFSVTHRRDASQDSSAVLAAVGAGMVPATMAILAPMVLGKKK